MKTEKKTYALFLTFLTLILVWNGLYSYGQEQSPQYKRTTLVSDSLQIYGDQIWIRSKPVTGKIVFKLNTGATALILEKGIQQTIGTVTDYWYHIRYQHQDGWVFGAQTSKKQDTEFPNFMEYLKEILPKHVFDTAFDDELQKKDNHPLIHPKLGYYRLYNPGTACVLYTEPLSSEKLPDIPIPQYYPNQKPNKGFCEESTSSDGVYFEAVDSFPTYIDFTDGSGYDAKPIPLSPKYRRGQKMKVVLLHKNWVIKTLYFIAEGQQWWLVVTDDCDCSA